MYLNCRWDCSSVFEIPEGIDIKDTKNVKWYIKYNTLFLETKDGKKFEIEGTIEDMKYPESITLMNEDGDIEEDMSVNPEFDSSDSEEEDSEESTEETDE
jgi:hypothetical protein